MTPTPQQRTPQQRAFLTVLTTTTANLALVARAGCGKTSTILLAVDAATQQNPRAEILVCAYNKAIADEVSQKLKERGHTDWRTVQASTAHALGFGLLKFVFKPQVDDKKVANLIAAQNEEVFSQYGSQIAQLVRYAKQAAFGFFAGIGDASAWYHLADHFDINGFDDTSSMDEVIQAAQTIYKLSLNQTDVVDFDDMIIFPLIKNLRVKFTKDLIFVDEYQDISPARAALIRKFLGTKGRIVLVGDDRQAIYGFSGADAQALPNGIAHHNCTVLPLSVTWRCPQAVVRLAQTLVPDIEAAPEAPEGEVNHIAGFDDETIASITKQDSILCRNTAPLIKLAYKLIRAGKPCKVEGRAIGDGLVALVRRWKVTTIAAFLTRLDAYQDREVGKALAKGNDTKVEEVEDRCQTLREIANAVQLQGKQQVADMVMFIQTLFADGAENVTVLATYHRSKGREWPHVYLYEHRTRCPSKAARQEWQKQQEANLAYVAFSRAMEKLTFVGA